MGSAVVCATFTATLLASPQELGEPLDLRRPVDQGLADRNPLGRSLRSLPSPIDVGRSFGRLYVDPRRPGRFLRRQGGLAAVFPQSVYVGEGAAGVPIVPPGTVFEIGRRDGDEIARTSEFAGAVAAPPAELLPSGENRVPPQSMLVSAGRWDPEGAAAGAPEPSRSPPNAGFGDPVAIFGASTDLADRVRPRLVRDRNYRIRRLDALFTRALGRTSVGD